jgi:hypothetical protein
MSNGSIADGGPTAPQGPDEAAPQAPSQAALQAEGALDGDSLDQVTPIRRVEQVTAAVTPLQRTWSTPAAPAKPQRVGVGLVLQPFSPVSKPRQMRTMSDLVDTAQPVRPSTVARGGGRRGVGADKGSTEP